MSRYILIRRLRWPAILLLIGVLALLHQAGVIAYFWRLFWPLLLIMVGVLLLAERAALAAEGDRAVSGSAVAGAANPAQAPARAIQSRRAAICALAPHDFENDVEWRATMSSVPPEYAAGRRRAASDSALRSEDAVARVSRAAAGRMARATRCMAGAAARLEGELCGRIRTARAFGRGSGDPCVRRRGCVAGGHGSHRFGRLLELVRAVVAAAADRALASRCWPSGRWTCAGRLLCGAAAASSEFWSCWPLWARWRGAQPLLGREPLGTSATTISSTASDCRSTTATSRCEPADSRQRID